LLPQAIEVLDFAEADGHSALGVLAYVPDIADPPGSWLACSRVIAGR